MEDSGEVIRSTRNSEHRLGGLTGSKGWTVGSLCFYFS